MIKKEALETIVGSLIILLAIYFAYYAYNMTSSTSNADSYNIKAKFANIDGINVGSDIKIAGIKIGTVSKQDLDNTTFEALLTLNIKDDYKIPTDTSAEIIGNGLLGDKYISLSPGSDDSVLQNNDFISFTQSSISIEKLVGKFMFGIDKPNEKAAAK